VPNRVVSLELPWCATTDVWCRACGQAAFVRVLKEEQGLGNEDPDVADAVGTLLRRKARLRALQDAAAAAAAEGAGRAATDAAAPVQA